MAATGGPAFAAAVRVIDRVHGHAAHRRTLAEPTEHRQAAWRVMLDHVPVDDRVGVVRTMAQAVDAWLTYRDDVAAACGIRRDELPLTA